MGPSTDFRTNVAPGRPGIVSRMTRDEVVAAVEEGIDNDRFRSLPPELVMELGLPQARIEAVMKRLQDIFMLRTDIEVGRWPNGVAVACIRDSAPIWAILRVADQEGATRVALHGPEEGLVWEMHLTKQG